MSSKPVALLTVQRSTERNRACRDTIRGMELAAGWVDATDWRGLVPMPSRQWLLEHHLVMSWVAGTEFRLGEIRDERFNPGSALLISPEPDNPHDAKALAVLSEDGSLHAGYLPGVIAHNFRDSDVERQALVLWEQGQSGHRVGLGILVSRESVVLESRVVTPAAARKLTRKTDQYRGRRP